MAAPCWRYAWRPLWRFTTGSWSVRSVASIAQKVPESQPSPWALYSAVCLQRLPVISKERSPMEEKVMELMYQMELERSLISDHELRLLEDAERMSRKQEADYDSDDEGGYGAQEIVTAQDLEDAWEQKLKAFQPALRTKASDTTDASTAERCLSDSLVFLVKQEVGSQNLWLMPHLPWEAGETLRQTAERALDASLPGLTVTFLGNAPCGYYRYRFPKAARTESRIGAKVFFFKAIMSGALPPPRRGPSAWLRRDELPDYLPPEYLKQVGRFVL